MHVKLWFFNDKLCVYCIVREVLHRFSCHFRVQSILSNHIIGESCNLCNLPLASVFIVCRVFHGVSWHFRAQSVERNHLVKIHLIWRLAPSSLFVECFMVFVIRYPYACMKPFYTRTGQLVRKVFHGFSWQFRAQGLVRNHLIREPCNLPSCSVLHCS